MRHHNNMSDERLHPSSAGKLLDWCPKKWRHWVQREWKPNKSMLGGSALHSLVLGGARVVEIEHPDYKKKIAKGERDKAVVAGLLPILSKDMALIRREADCAIEKLATEHDVDSLVCEETVQWEDDGVLLEGTPDALDLEKRVVIELKRTANITRFGNTLADMHYDLQAAAYVEAAESKHGGIWSHKFLVVEEGEPFCTRFDYLSPVGIALGATKWGVAKTVFKRCAQSGVWPDYEDEIHEPRPWQMERFGL